MTISIRTSITGVKSLPNALQITRALRDTFSAVDEHKMLDNLSNWPYFHYFKNEDDEFIDAVSYGYDFGKEVSPEEFVATVFPNGFPTRSKRKKDQKTRNVLLIKLPFSLLMAHNIRLKILKRYLIQQVGVFLSTPSKNKTLRSAMFLT